MAGFAGNEQDGFEALMAQVEADNAVNNEPIAEAVEPVQESQAVVTQVDEQVMDSVEPEVAPQVETETPNLRQAVPQEQVTPQVDWEHKFQTVEGMLKAQSGEAKEFKATMEAKLEAERTARLEAERQLAEVPLDYESIMGEEAFDDLGEDATNGISKLIKAELAKKDMELDKLKSVIENMQDGFKQKSADEEAIKEENKGTLHDNRILAEVPDFFKLTKDQDFIKYLEAEKDPLTQIPLRTAFEDADSAYDSVIVANICKMYKAVRDQKQAGAYKLEEHVAPSINSATPEPDHKPIMKMADYNVMVEKMINQKITDAEWTNYNNAFELAKLEGRVQ